ncbi:methyl-accepting chemotaxis protein [Chitiniphilus eburneus]|uniref:Methyl-accepting chemotaxis protein n=1 Tax=Chitiniphilus eburneus TaxID=2571148 RepID=A0A4U0PIX6_9NEIS|nr:methyl-accepting chemotaxis protein [Chitiniphilus eburneus]TJZ67142.1 methyl-accepting chemotaxis protein [Chitiniphilus eburneus]
MKISQRLLLLIAIAILSLVVVGAVGFVKFNRVEERVSRLGNEAVAGLETLYRVNNAFKVQQLVLYQIGSSFDTDLRTRLIQRLKDQEKELASQVAHYETAISDPAERALFQKLQPQLATFDKSSRDVLQTAEDFGDVAASLTATRDTAIATEQALQALVDYKLKLASTYRTEVAEEQRSARIQFVVLILAAIALLAVIGTLLTRAIQRPLAEMQRTVTEIGNTLDFTRRAPVNSQDEIGQTVTAFNTLIGRLQESLREMRNRIGDVAGSANQLSYTAGGLTRTATQASEAASNMAATVEQVTVSINHVADRSGEADELSRESGRLAEDGGQVIESTVAKIDGIADTVREAADEIAQLQGKSADISAVVNVIKEIADQTNLLALNAAIEAARAGEQGRGFAVVADEVRKLAERTSSSTQEISGTIASIQDGANLAVGRMQNVVSQVEDGVGNARAAGDAIRRIRGSAGDVVGRVADITEAIREQSVASNSIAQVVETIARMSEENSAAAGNTSQAAEHLQQLARDMEQTISRYRV